ncbi:MAG: metalloregulator ArsR/SmtB family transcription factor [Cyanobacteria bacterium J06623_7]
MSVKKSPTVPVCTSRHGAEASRTELKLEVLDPNKAQEMAEFFRLLGDGNRLRILALLAQQDLCVCDLARLLSMSDSAVSHQLRTLRSLRLVAYSKQGRRVYYRLLDRHVLELYSSVAEHLAELDN